MNDELVIEVRISEERVTSDDTLHLVERFLFDGRPYEFIFLGRQFCERRENMCSSRPHVAVVIDKADESTDLLDGFWRSKISNCFNFLCEGTDAIARHPVSKVFAFEAAKE